MMIIVSKIVKLKTDDDGADANDDGGAYGVGYKL